MTDMVLFTDGSVNPQLKIGFGAYLVVPDQEFLINSLKMNVKVKRFEQTSSTKLELQTLLWALNDIQAARRRVTVYTDSQNIVGLPGRRLSLEKNRYRSKKNKRIKNYELYQEFYSTIDQMDCKFIKVQGHKVSTQKNDIDRLFSLVDKASRKALRKNNL